MIDQREVVEDNMHRAASDVRDSILQVLESKQYGPAVLGLLDALLMVTCSPDVSNNVKVATKNLLRETFDTIIKKIEESTT